MLSEKAKCFRPSPTLELAAKAKEMKDRGEDVISLTVGEPDWPTYKIAADAGVKAIHDGKTKYTPPQGIPPLRQAITGLVKDLIGVSYAANEVTVSCGAKFVIFAGFQALLNPGDEVLIPAPFWASYSEMVELAGGKPKVYLTKVENRFKMTPQELKENITSKTKIFLFNSPCNPTGIEYSFDELKGLAEVITAHPKLAVITDDIYNQLSLSEKGISPHILQVAPNLRDRVICVNGMSKAYSMTGWRIGWATGPKDVIHAMASYQSQTVGSSSSIAQEASVVAIKNCQQDIIKTRQELRERAAYAYEAFSSIDGFTVLKPDAAFYLWINIKPVLHKLNLNTAQQFAAKLMNEHKVVVVPGDEFGDSNYIRISFAATRKDIDGAVERIKKMS
ncbi:MAG: pyridoxal phosphate-dependent aminotransferase [Bdellovibrionaceae bacterium]|nr:pyridoxal phosphate-dependent aminotransferase [Pseudobdellovibrionaceae bacterium]